MFRRPTLGSARFSAFVGFLLSWHSYRRGRRKSRIITGDETGWHIKIFNFPFVHWSTPSEMGSKTIFETVSALCCPSGRELDIILKARELE